MNAVASPEIKRLIALARAAGDEPVVERDAESVGYRFTHMMPDSVREAGFLDERTDYHRSAEEDPPVEGFVDSAAGVWLFFPLDPAHDILGPLVEGGGYRRSRFLFPLMVAGGTGMVLFALLIEGPERAWLLGAAVVWLVVAFGVRRWL